MLINYSLLWGTPPPPTIHTWKHTCMLELVTRTKYKVILQSLLACCLRLSQSSYLNKSTSCLKQIKTKYTFVFFHLGQIRRFFLKFVSLVFTSGIVSHGSCKDRMFSGSISGGRQQRPMWNLWNTKWSSLKEIKQIETKGCNSFGNSRKPKEAAGLK